MLIEHEEIIKGLRRIAKRLTDERKRLHWEAYARKTERQEEMFQRVFSNVFLHQGKEIANNYRKYGRLPNDLNDEETAKKFEVAIQLIYEDAFEVAI